MRRCTDFSRLGIGYCRLTSRHQRLDRAAYRCLRPNGPAIWIAQANGLATGRPSRFRRANGPTFCALSSVMLITAGPLALKRHLAISYPARWAGLCAKCWPVGPSKGVAPGDGGLSAMRFACRRSMLLTFPRWRRHSLGSCMLTLGFGV